MIDFIATRSDINSHTSACARMLTAVIAQAVRDACEPPSATERERNKNLKDDSIEALLFLFFDDPAFKTYAKLAGPSTFEAYSGLIGIPHDRLRAALLAPTGGGIDESQRRTLRIRLQWLRQAADARSKEIETKKGNRRGYRK